MTIEKLFHVSLDKYFQINYSTTPAGAIYSNIKRQKNYNDLEFGPLINDPSSPKSIEKSFQQMKILSGRKCQQHEWENVAVFLFLRENSQLYPSTLLFLFNFFSVSE